MPSRGAGESDCSAASVNTARSKLEGAVNRIARLVLSLGYGLGLISPIGFEFGGRVEAQVRAEHPSLNAQAYAVLDTLPGGAKQWIYRGARVVSVQWRKEVVRDKCVDQVFLVLTTSDPLERVAAFYRDHAQGQEVTTPGWNTMSFDSAFSLSEGLVGLKVHGDSIEIGFLLTAPAPRQPPN
jgi:hypothetical protein